MAAMIDSLLTLTPEAREKIDGVRSFNEFPDAVLRVRVLAKEGRSFRYEIALEDPGDRNSDDLSIDASGLTVVVDPTSAADLAGAVIALDDAVTGGGLRIENPNEGWQDPVARAVQDVLDQQINPGVGTHGGTVTLVDVKDGTAFMRFWRRVPGMLSGQPDAQAGRRDGDPSGGTFHFGHRGCHRSRGRRQSLLPARALGRGERGKASRGPARRARQSVLAQTGEVGSA